MQSCHPQIGQVSFQKSEHGSRTRRCKSQRASANDLVSVVFGNRLANVRAECEMLFEDIQWRMMDPVDRGNASTDAESGCSRERGCATSLANFRRDYARFLNSKISSPRESVSQLLFVDHSREYTRGRIRGRFRCHEVHFVLLVSHKL